MHLIKAAGHRSGSFSSGLRKVLGKTAQSRQHHSSIPKAIAEASVHSSHFQFSIFRIALFMGQTRAPETDAISPLDNADHGLPNSRP